MLKTVLTAAACAGLMFCASAALAGESNVSRVKVTFTDRELHDPALIETSYQRLNHAAKEACESFGAGPAWRATDDQICEEQAMDEALLNLGNDMRQYHKQTAVAAQVASADRKER